MVVTLSLNTQQVPRILYYDGVRVSTIIYRALTQSSLLDPNGVGISWLWLDSPVWPVAAGAWSSGHATFTSGH